MAEVLDIMLDDAGEDVMSGGDFGLGDPAQINSKLLIVCEKGENKMEPASGVGISSWILDEVDGDELKKEIQAELEDDGLVVRKLIIEGENVTVAAKYGR